MPGIDTPLIELGFVAALEREVAAIVRGWSCVEVQWENSRWRVYRHGSAILVCGGVGVERAEKAALMFIERYSPKMLVSVGFVGSCVSDLSPGAVVVPAFVVDSSGDKCFSCVGGAGQVVTDHCVAGRQLKQELKIRFGALAVDMEAAGVASVAQEAGKQFAAIKVISDGVEEDLSFLSAFVKPEGFQAGSFLAYIALRPWVWPQVASLQRNSKLAARALQSAIGECLDDWQTFFARHSCPAAQV